jgi:hypothetical protein
MRSNCWRLRRSQCYPPRTSCDAWKTAIDASEAPAFSRFDPSGTPSANDRYLARSGRRVP